MIAESLPSRRLVWCEQALKRLAVDVSAQSRLHRMKGYLRHSEIVPDSLHQARQRLLVAEAGKFAFELMVILMAALDSPPAVSPFSADKLAFILDGGDETVGGNQLARNTQFELFAPALMSVAGFDIRRGRADADWHFADEILTLEAKRVNSASPNAMEKRIREAAGKLRGPASTGLIQVVQGRGLILLNIDVHLDSVAHQPSDDEMKSLMRSRIEPVKSAIDRASRNYAVLGILVFGHTRCWVNLGTPPEPHLLVTYPAMFISMVGSDPGEVSLSSRINRAMEAVRLKTLEIAHSVPAWH